MLFLIFMNTSTIASGKNNDIDHAFFKLRGNVTSSEFLTDEGNLLFAFGSGKTKGKETGILDRSRTYKGDITPETLAKSLESPNVVEHLNDRLEVTENNPLASQLADLTVLTHYVREAISPVLESLQKLLKQRDLSQVLRDKAEYVLKNLQIRTPKAEVA